MSERGKERDGEDEVVDYEEEEEYYEEDGDGGGEGEGEEEDVEQMLKRVSEMDDELAHISKVQSGIQKQLSSAAGDLDENSVYVGQVDYAATVDDLRAHFAPCGTINRISIAKDKQTGQAKGFAYIEFVEKESVANALQLDDTPFKGRQLKVLPKRQTVVPGHLGGRGGRGRGGRGFGGRGGRGGGFGFGGGGRFSGGRGRGAFRGGRGRFSGGGRGRGRSSDYNSSYY